MMHSSMNTLPPVQDTVIGKIYFLLVRIKLKHMEIEIRRRETIGSGSNARNESETLAKYEIMDGAPVRGENIPIRWASMGSSAPCQRAFEDGCVPTWDVNNNCKGRHWAHRLQRGCCALCTVPTGARKRTSGM